MEGCFLIPSRRAPFMFFLVSGTISLSLFSSITAFVNRKIRSLLIQYSLIAIAAVNRTFLLLPLKGEEMALCPKPNA